MRVRIVGEVPVLMRDYVEERQLWLPHTVALVCVREAKPDPPPPEVLSPEGVHKRMRQPYSRVPARFQRMFVHVAGVHQRCLPYPAYRRLSNSESRLAEEADFPGWERNDEGRVARFDFKPELTDGFRLWCHEFCEGRYMVKRGHAAFELWVEAALARISV